jgi:hypothetical protein
MYYALILISMLNGVEVLAHFESATHCYVAQEVYTEQAMAVGYTAEYTTLACVLTQEM